MKTMLSRQVPAGMKTACAVLLWALAVCGACLAWPGAAHAAEWEPSGWINLTPYSGGTGTGVDGTVHYVPDGTYLVASVDESQYLSGVPENEGDLTMNALDGSRGQQWLFVRHPDNPAVGTPQNCYIIHSADDSAYVLDVKDGRYVEGTPVQMYEANGSDAQYWFIDDNKKLDGGALSISFVAFLRSNLGVQVIESDADRGWDREKGERMGDIARYLMLDRTDGGVKIDLKTRATPLDENGLATINGTSDPAEQWKIRRAQYGVLFRANGGSGSMSAQSFNIDDAAQALSGNAFWRNGYRFTGWNTAPDGSGTSYANRQEVANLTDRADSTVTLYAQWEPVQVRIPAALDISVGGRAAWNAPDLPVIKQVAATATAFYPDGTNDSASIANATSRVQLGGANGIVRTNAGFALSNVAVPEGYHVGSFRAEHEYVDPDGYWLWEDLYKGPDATQRVDVPLGSQEAAFRLDLAPNAYTVRFNGNGATGGSTADQAMAYDTVANLNANGFERPGWRFTGWSTAADGSGTAYADGAEVKNLASGDGAVVELYAQWEQKTFTVEVPTVAAWAGMPAGEVNVSDAYEVRLFGDFDGTVSVSSDAGSLSAPGTSDVLAAETRSARTPLAFTAAGTQEDSVSITGTARCQAEWSGTVPYLVQNDLPRR